MNPKISVPETIISSGNQIGILVFVNLGSETPKTKRENFGTRRAYIEALRRENLEQTKLRIQESGFLQKIEAILGYPLPPQDLMSMSTLCLTATPQQIQQLAEFNEVKVISWADYPAKPI